MNSEMLEQRLSKRLSQNKETVEALSGSSDIIFSPLRVAGHNCYAMWCDGMINRHDSWDLVYRQIKQVSAWRYRDPDRLVEHLCGKDAILLDASVCATYKELLQRVLAGFSAILIEGSARAVVVGTQGYSYRAVSESFTEENVRSSREGFVEPLRVNMTLIRRRIKSNLLIFETSTIGSVSQTDIAIVYLKDRVSEALLETVRKRLTDIDLEMVLESGFIEPFFESGRKSLFSGTGHTERPDSLCAKLADGRIGILVDGTPFAIVLPFLFSENFQSLDDYTNRPYYVNFMRVVKYLSFFMSIFFPGLYVAVVNFNPEIIPSGLLYNIALAQQSTPFPLMFEAMFIHIVYEIVREAGLRMPRPVGHAVGLIGALVIGEAAVSAGIIGSPMVMVVALTAISSFIIPQLYEPISILRFVFIIVGGLFGPLGLTLGLAVLLISIGSINAYGVPYASPFTPFSKTFYRDGLVRLGWPQRAGARPRLSNLPGSRIEEGDIKDGK